MRPSVSAALVILGLSLPAYAVDQTNLNATDGSNPLLQYGRAASTSCGEFIAATYGMAPNQHSTMMNEGRRYYDTSFALMEWAMGFVTAVNAVAAYDPPPRTPQIETDGAALSLWLSNWCTDHPTDQFGTVVMRFVIEYRKR